MKALLPPSRLLRTIAIPLLCAFFALAGIAGARAGAEKLADPARSGHFALCLPSGKTGLPSDKAGLPTEDPGSTLPPDHDCGLCCLALGTALPPPGQIFVGEDRPASPDPVLSGEHQFREAPRLLPWSRGPPATA
jgi:hypothetical protein